MEYSDDQTEFVNWLREHRVDEVTANVLNALATSPEDAEAAYQAMEIGPPIDTRAGMRKMNDEDLCGVKNISQGFLFVGACPNGDPIAVDIGNDLGSVWYVSHGEMHSEPLRSVAVRVANCFYDFAMAMTDEADTSGFAIDYFDAKRRNWVAPSAEDVE